MLAIFDFLEKFYRFFVTAITKVFSLGSNNVSYAVFSTVYSCALIIGSML